MALLFQLTQKLAHGFSAAWSKWPRKEAKKDAEKAWHQKVTTPETEDKVFAAFEWQIPMLLERDPQYRPLLASWLRGERWEDEPPTPKKQTTATASRHTASPMALQQMDASARIRSLVATGMAPEQAKQQVYREMGWVK